jgi:hypothetical protein
VACQAPVDKSKSHSDSGGGSCEPIRFAEDAARLRVPYPFSHGATYDAAIVGRHYKQRRG